MKKISIPIVLLLTLLFLACNNENLESDEVLQSEDPNFRVLESTVKHNFAFRASSEEPCLTTNLIAGQDFENPIGTVTIDSDGDNIILTYDTSESDWTINLTHMSIGHCDQSIPTTGSGNPKVGRFEHTEPHTENINNVVYMVDLDALIAEHDLEDVYCFAAHAEVTGPDSEETAWAEGTGFEGNNWAMFVQTSFSECGDDDIDNDGIPNEIDVDQDGDGFLDKVLDEETGTYLPLISYPQDSENYDENVDNCPEKSNVSQSDYDGDGIGDLCDDDIDGDGSLNVDDPDMDNDTVLNEVDNCPKTNNPDQADNDRIYNEIGEVIGYQPDPDGVGDACDNCSDIPNEDQIDLNGDGIGDACAPVK